MVEESGSPQPPAEESAAASADDLVAVPETDDSVVAASSEGAAGESAAAVTAAHEKVEGIDDLADVVVPGAVAASAAKDVPRRKLFARKDNKAPAASEAALVPSQKSQKPERRKIALLEGFRDPVRRPRFILWTGAAVLGLAAVMMVALGVTSTRWFCAEGCHKVQDDTIIAYEHSAHAEISCMACHMPVNSNPVVFILHKAEALGELYLTVTNDYELPLNGKSHVALTMHAEQCTQCHDTERRRITPSVGILIDHEAHAKKDVACAICHNRVAHNEDFDLTLSDPKTGEPNRKHENFMSMTACFRCHSQDAGTHGELSAPGECSACHPADFPLKPASHLEPDFFPKKHGELGNAAASKVASATSEADGGAEAEGGHEGESIGTGLPRVETINECSTCHSEKFCSDCHGLPMPHPADFRKGHGDLGKKNPKACVQCHGAADTFCNECHHGAAMNRKYDQSKSWFKQHPAAAGEVGSSACFDCHSPTYCANCHVNSSSQ